jgi:hypothetical protein
VGEEIVGPIDLPRPQNGGCLAMALTGLWMGFVRITSESVADHVGQNFNWPDGEIRSADAILSIVTLLATLGILSWWSNRSNPKLRVIKAQESRSTATTERVEVWSGDALAERAIVPTMVIATLSLCSILWVLAMPAMTFGWLAALRGVLVVTLLGVVIFPAVLGLFRPLLALDPQNVVVHARRIAWENVNCVEVEHRLNVFGGFAAVKFTFFDAGQRKLGQVALPAERCGVLKEEELLEFIAARLGRRYEHLAPTALDWL